MLKRMRDIMQLTVLYPHASHASLKRWYIAILSVSRTSDQHQYNIERNQPYSGAWFILQYTVKQFTGNDACKHVYV